MPSIGKVYDEATRITNSTFFDYGNISAFEDKVMKRLFPYWTYFSRNLAQWPDLIAKNPSRFVNLNKTILNLGRKPTDRERRGIPEYLLKTGTRVGSDGKLINIPNISLHDAISFGTENPLTSRSGII